MDREIIDLLLVGAKRLEEDKWVGVENTNGAVGGGGDEVARERREVGLRVEGEGSERSGVVMERTQVGG